ncbi:DUF2333 family protein [Dyella subtropica]|uniref:DUF2333 family protein n=1 Tax=Dyella subtropica TaxID=2992127 RepID=UPI00225BC220|nr:DUF2333 family protein [Dyella subtropica]
MQAKDSPARPSHGLLRVVLVLLALPLLLVSLATWLWDKEPVLLDPAAPSRTEQTAMKRPVTPGAATTVSLIRSVQALVEKHAGHPAKGHRHPSDASMDSTPGWERGSLMASRDLLHVLRSEFGRPQAPLIEDKDLADADVLLSGHSSRWSLRNPESQYRKVAYHLQGYLDRLTDDDPDNAHFYASASHLADYLQVASTRLDALAQRLTSGVTQPRPGEFSPPHWPVMAFAQTLHKGGPPPWRRNDDTFFEARGYTSALLLQMKAFQHDFASVLKDPGAQANLQLAIQELEAVQQSPAHPLALNGAPSIRFPDHALAMAGYVSRVSSAVSELRDQLRGG